MENTVYEPPTLVEIGDFEELTLCSPWGSCRDFAGCGRAFICIG
ncbi:lasso RiPP family leader peptide-containing protein [Streptomyces sp. NPDC021096]